MGEPLNVEWQKYELNFSYEGAGPRLISDEIRGARIAKISRVAYIIRTDRPHAFSYLNGRSAVCYIGSGELTRILDHCRNWISKIQVFVSSEIYFHAYVAVPRRRNDYYAYREAEAAAQETFRVEFGENPVFNGKAEHRHSDYDIEYDRNVFGLGRGPGYTKFFRSFAVRFKAY